MTNIATAAHDSYLLFIDTKEDEMSALVHAESAALFMALQRDETARNRARVLEINAFYKYEKKELDELEED